MDILHTADIHLKADDPRTVDAVEDLLAKANQLDVDLLTIGGDLFDTPEDAEQLRPHLRQLFQDNPFDILAIPGNHDEDVYRENLRFGNDLEIMTETPYSTRTVGDVEIVGVPFISEMDEQLFSALLEKQRSRTEVLLLHCTLDIGFHSGVAGEEQQRYFPVTKATLSELDYPYILAGHIHSQVREVPLANGATFIYPGSPVSHTKTETGKRNAVLIDTDEDDISTIPLDTFYYDSYSTTVRPGSEDAVLAEIDEWVSRRKDDDSEMTLAVEGFVERDEDEFYEQLCEAADPVDPRDRTRSVSHILNHPLYERFETKLAERDDLDQPDEVETRVIEVLSELIAQNRVQAA